MSFVVPDLTNKTVQAAQTTLAGVANANFVLRVAYPVLVTPHDVRVATSAPANAPQNVVITDQSPKPNDGLDVGGTVTAILYAMPI